MRWLKWIGGLVAVLLVILGGGLVYVATLDPEAFRQPISAAVKQATGREFDIAGPMDLGISLRPRIVANDITLANADWGSRPELARIKRVEIVARLLPLLTGAVSIVRVDVVEADILLETDGEGRGNWRFGGDDGSDGAPASATLPSIGAIRITDSKLIYIDGVDGGKREVLLRELTGQAESSGDPLDFRSLIEIDGRPLEVAGKIGPLANLAAGENVDVDVNGNAMGLSFSARGRAGGTGGDVALSMSAQTFAGLPAPFGELLPAGLPFEMMARLKTAPEKVSVSDLKLRLGDSDLAGHADIAFRDPRPMISGKLSARRLDLQQLLATENRRPGESGASNNAGQTTARVFPDTPLALDGLRAVDAAIEVQAAEVKTPRLTLRDIATTVTLAAGRLSLKPLRLVVAGSAVSGTAILDASKKVPALKLSVDAPRLDVGALLKETGTSDMLEGTATFRAEVAGSGPSVAAIMAGLDGETRLLMNKGRMRTQAFDIAVGGLSAVMGGLFSDQQEWTVLNCAASKFDIEKGVASSRVMLIDAEYSTVTGAGRIDLGKETLDLKVTPESKSATLNLAVPIIVGGTLLAPTFRPDETATAQRIGGLLAGTVFPPAALLSLADLGSGEEHPCLRLAADSGKRPAAKSTVDKATQAVKDATDKTSRAVKDAAGTASDAAKGAVDSVTKGIKGLFGKD